jgi:hypothetical protein
MNCSHGIETGWKHTWDRKEGTPKKYPWRKRKKWKNGRKK